DGGRHYRCRHVELLGQVASGRSDTGSHDSQYCRAAKPPTRATERGRIPEEAIACRRTTADTVVITDCHGVIEYVNPAFEALTGYSRDETHGKTPRILIRGARSRDLSGNVEGDSRRECVSRDPG